MTQQDNTSTAYDTPPSDSTSSTDNSGTGWSSTVTNLLTSAAQVGSSYLTSTQQSQADIAKANASANASKAGAATTAASSTQKIVIIAGAVLAVIVLAFVFMRRGK